MFYTLILSYVICIECLMVRADDVKYCYNFKEISAEKCDQQDTFDIRWQVIDERIGQFQSEFLLDCLDSGYRYDIILYIDESIQTVGECLTENYDRFNNSVHTRTRLIATDNDTSCVNQLPNKHMIKLMFKFVFPGCYTVKLSPRSETGLEEISRSKPVFLNSTYQKLLLSTNASGLALNGSFNYDENTLSLHIDCAPLLSWTAIQMSIRYGIEIQIIRNIFRIRQEDPASLDDEETDCAVLHTNQVRCDFIGLPRENFTIVAVLKYDIRCEPQTLWTLRTDTCRWAINYRKEIEVPLNTTEIFEKPLSGINTILISSSIFCCILIAALVVLKYYHGTEPEPKPQFRTLPQISYPQTDILLLYAAGDDAFMNMMDQFKEIIKKSVQCPVHDMHHLPSSSQVCAFQNEWILDKFQRNCRIVLTLTKEALERYDVVNRSKRAHMYDMYDRLFIFAIKQLEAIVEVAEYTRVFVLYLDCDVQYNFRTFDFINRYTRYALPIHLPKLMDAVCGTAFDWIDIEKSPEYERFNQFYNCYVSNKFTNTFHV